MKKVLVFSWQSFGLNDAIEGFKSLDFEVHTFTHQDVYMSSSKEFDRTFYNAYSARDYEFVFSLNYYPIISQNCQKYGIKYISLVYDWPLMGLFSCTVINPVNYIFVFDKATVMDFRRGGVNNIFYAPLAVNVERLDEIGRGFYIEKDKDVTFIGPLYNEENSFAKKLEGASDYIRGYLDGVMKAQGMIYGTYFIEDLLTDDIVKELERIIPIEFNRDSVIEKKYVYAYFYIARYMTQVERYKTLKDISEYYKLYLYTNNNAPNLPKAINKGPADYLHKMPYAIKSSKINLNITLRSIRTGIPLRALDIMGCGGFLLTNFQTDFQEHFVQGIDYVHYDSNYDMEEKLNYFLVHDDERETIAKRGYEKVKKLHTFEVRLAEILKIVYGKD
ncbi:spore maturation protein CgeB [Acetitomaculum ruminis DSM 5522]|uniref:Spore maturation protein CgeB n=1 Tax=Acetitomaculum ruminis DSM 5522 TaxID=1120918 RepID=A0A1I0WZB8_9FIRM|nr:glycosyltransferase [Acetitomaculum ruminis]SFA94069.1 spore maturation protein CgeB [Acetitomaculum ruminis DSM 5522]